MQLHHIEMQKPQAYRTEPPRWTLIAFMLMCGVTVALLIATEMLR